jgi:N-acetylmuramoyl-L-alanine amidase
MVAVGLGLSGCATAPRTRDSFPYPTVMMHGASYFALLPMCEREGVAWDYDPLSKVLILKKGGLEVKLLVGSRTLMAADTVKELSAPIMIKESVIYVPLEVRDTIVPPAPPAPPACAFEKRERGAVYLKPIRSVILDAGHGGKDPGALGRRGLKEKDVVLDVVEKITCELKRCGLSVDTTRSSDQFVPLSRRSQIANDKRADLFVSIHANANRSRWIEGFEVYYLTEGVDDDARALAAAENASLEIESQDFHSRFLSLKAMLWDMVYTENRKESIELAHFISRSVSKKMHLKLLGVKGAPFAVLKGARMPAVLVEVGYISNRAGERNLRDASYRKLMAEAIAAGIVDFKNYCEGKK